MAPRIVTKITGLIFATIALSSCGGKPLIAFNNSEVAGQSSIIAGGPSFNLGDSGADAMGGSRAGLRGPFRAVASSTRLWYS